MIDHLIDNVMNRSRTVLFILLFSICAGIYAFTFIPKEADPDVPIPVAMVQIIHQGISPEDAERLLLRPMEAELQSLEGLDQMVGNATEGLAYIVLEFDVNFDQDQTLIEVREKVDLARAKLPQDTEEPIVQEVNVNLFPMVIVGLGGNIPERELYRLGRRLQDRLEGIAPVLRVDLNGARDELLEVIVDPVKLDSHNITQQELLSAVTQNNRLISSGAIDTGNGRFAVKIPGTFNTAEDIFDLVIKASGQATVTLSDVADIRRTFADRTQFTTFNGKPSITLEVVKRLGANIIDTNELVREVVAEEQKNWPDGVEVNFILDQSRYIYNMLSQLQASILTAVTLVMIVIVAVLGLRPGLMVGISIPTSFLLAFTIIMFKGDTLNMMTMFAMVIAVGILVDGAIVIIEYADRKMAEGLLRKEAYGLAAKRMFWPIFSSTLTTLAAFIPLLFWPGVFGKFMGVIPQTLIIVLLSSFVMAIFFLPVIGTYIGRTLVKNTDDMKALAAGEDMEQLDNLKGGMGSYIKLVHKVTRHPLAVVGIALALVFSIFQIYFLMDVETKFMPDSEPDSFVVFVGAIGNLSTEEASILVSDVDRKIRELPGLKSVQTTINSGQSRFSGFNNPPPSDTIGTINVELVEWEDREQSGWEIIEQARQKASNFPGLRIELRERQMGPDTGKDIQVELRSHNPQKLLNETIKVRNYFDQDKDLIDVEDTRSLPGIEWVLNIDRELAGRFGADVTQVGAQVQMVTNGLWIGDYRPDDAEEEVDIRVRYPAEYRSLSQLDNLRIQTSKGQIPISNIVKREPQDKINKIDRLDGQRVFRIRANTGTHVLDNGKLEKINVNDKVSDLESWILEEANLDPAVTYVFRGANEESEELQTFFVFVAMAILFLMGVILLTQFNNFYYVFITLSSIILSTAGVLIGIMVTGQEFALVMSGLGIIALAGIVVNNNIVLIDTFQRLRQTGLDIHDAIVRTAAQRIRPVLLTTVTTICGLIPMMMKINLDFFERSVTSGGPSAGWWVPLSTAVIFGLGFSTLITLVLTPSLLALPHHIKSLWKGGKKSTSDDIHPAMQFPEAAE